MQCRFKEVFMTILDQLKKLNPYEERSFVSREAILENLEELMCYYHALLRREILNEPALEQWLKDRSEMEAAADQVRTFLYIQMTCQTDNQEYAEKYKNYIENIIPSLKELSQELDKKYLNTMELLKINPGHHGMIFLKKKNSLELFRKENIPFQTREALLCQEYQALCGAMTVEFDGQEQTLQMMRKYLHEPDRELREKAWRAITARRLKDSEKMNTLFNELVELRTAIARNAGFKNFMEYQFKAFNRFDYTPEDCLKFHKSVEECVVSLLAKVYNRRIKNLAYKSIKPWDTEVDIKNRPPLKPFEDIPAFENGIQQIFNSIDGELGNYFGLFRKWEVLDLISRKGKAPGAYQSTLSETRKPFIFLNAVGLDSDIRTLLHESGHAFHVLAAASKPLMDDREPPIEFCEVASMSMELIGSHFLNHFYNEEDVKRARTELLEEIISILPWIATIDAFQHWIYSNPKHSVEQRNQVWVSIRKRFGGYLLDWEGLENEHSNLWQRQLHLFEYPFYYIEYGIAQLGALQLWMRYKKEPKEAIKYYKQGLSLGATEPLPKLFESTGLIFDFSEKMIQPLMKEIEKELKEND